MLYPKRIVPAAILRRKVVAVFAIFFAITSSIAAFAQQPARGRLARPPDAAQAGQTAPEQRARPPAPTFSPLPPDQTTQHTIRIGEGALAFAATAGTIRLANPRNGDPVAIIAYIAFTRPDTDVRTRPVTFVWNGGPGYASGWLNLGALGPWRLDMGPDAARPSAQARLHDNQETWLDFTDLVFIDPAGTGYGRIPGGEEAQRNLWSVDGDIASLATTIRRWSEANDRMASPKFLAGESYGGFRVPKVAKRLQNEEGVGINGLMLISPVLDFGRFRSQGVLSHVARLPSYAATAREKAGEITHASLADVESYARGAFLADLMLGLKDQQALERLSDSVARLTGLDKALVSRLGGRIPADVFRREIHKPSTKIASGYDGSVTSFDPDTFSNHSNAEDQLLNGLHAPIVQAMVEMYHKRLRWVVQNGRYVFRNGMAGRQWQWGNRSPEAIGDLARALALDPKLRVLVAHGLTDLVTPYFESQMTLDQMPEIGHPGRLQFEVYPGGHMFYTRKNSRKKFRADVKALVAGSQ